MSENSGPIQTTPRGLLGLLQLKNLGRNPDLLIGNVQPTVEMTPWWLSAIADVDPVIHTAAFATQSHLVNGPVVNLGPKGGESWYVHEYTLEVLTGVGATEEAINCAPVMFLTGTGVIRWQGLTEDSISVTSTATAEGGGIITARNFWVPPGAGLGFYCGRITSAGVVTFNMQAFKTVLPA